MIGAFVRGLSDRDIESLAREAGLGTISKTTVSGIYRELRDRYRAFRARSIGDVRLLALFLDAIYLPVLARSRRQVLDRRPSGPAAGRPRSSTTRLDQRATAGRRMTPTPGDATARTGKLPTSGRAKSSPKVADNARRRCGPGWSAGAVEAMA